MTQFDAMKAFVRAWCTSVCIARVAALTGLDERQCSNTAAYLRRIGVPLPRMSRRASRVRKVYMDAEDVLELKALASELIK